MDNSRIDFHLDNLRAYLRRVNGYEAALETWRQDNRKPMPDPVSPSRKRHALQAADFLSRTFHLDNPTPPTVDTLTELYVGSHKRWEAFLFSPLTPPSERGNL